MQAATRFAVVVGNNVGDLHEPALRWAEEDARRVRDLLVELGGVVDDRAVLLLGAKADRLRTELVRLRGQIEEANRQGYRTELVLFYSGHGDAEALHLRGTRLPLAELADALAAVPASATVTILDACRSSVLGTGRGKGAVHGPAFDISLARQAGPSGRVTITSAAADEIAQESDHVGGSFFTHHLLSGWRGAADADRDGRVTLAESYGYAYHRTLAASHAETAAVQHPELNVDLEGEGELVMTTLGRSGARLVLPPALAGELLVVDDKSGRVLAELHKAPGESITLALPSGRYRAQLRHLGRIYAGELALEWGGSAELTPARLREQQLVAAVEKGAQLDPEPWGIAVEATFGEPAALGEGVAFGPRFVLARPLRDDVLLAGELAVAYASAENAAWRYRHFQLRAGVGAAWARHFGPVRLMLGATAGALVIEERARRAQPKRVAVYTDAAAESRGATAGPYVAPRLGARVAITGPWSFVASGGLELSWLRVSGAMQAGVAWQGGAGAELQL